MSQLASGQSLDISVVIPNARSYPHSLVEGLLQNAGQNDEIIVVKNQPARLAFWTGNNEHSGNSCRKDARSGSHSNLKRAAGRPLSHDPRLRELVCRVSGVAAARNVGWRKATNPNILFLDDDILPPRQFLSLVRELARRPRKPGVITFRIVSPKPPEGFARAVGSLISLDRGPSVRSSWSTHLRLPFVWRFGCGAALLSPVSVLEATGGFKTHLATGRPDGGTEDAEFLWHSSRHTSVQYFGRIPVTHRMSASARYLESKLVEYGRAIGHLAGLAIQFEGTRYLDDFCAHVGSLVGHQTGPTGSASEDARARAAVDLTISETMRAFRRACCRASREDILCERCRSDQQ